MHHTFGSGISVKCLAISGVIGAAMLFAGCTDSSTGGTGGGAGSSGNGGNSGSGGSGNSGGGAGNSGSGGKGGTSGSGGSGSGGNSGSGGSGSGGSSGTGGTTTASTVASTLFNCKFAWGEPLPSGSLSSYSWLSFISNWAGYEMKADGSLGTFTQTSFLQSMASTSLVPAYYAYLIGYYGHANNLPDGNTASSGQANLTTGGAYLLLSDPTGANAPCNSTTTFCKQNVIVQAYASYAKQTYALWPTKPLIWLLEGDFIQYTYTTQVASLTSTSGSSAALTYTQLGQLAALIADAIKSNMPNAIVAIDDSAWTNDTDRPLYYQGIANANTNYDLVWTTGVGNNSPYLSTGTTSTSYNAKTATYSWLHSFTGKKILVDESAGASQASDTWSNQSAATLNTQIANGVIAVNVSGAPSNYQSNVTALASQLNSTCP